MPLFHSKRNENLTEWMDRPDCNPELLSNTYAQFAGINRLLSGWEKIYRQHLKPVFEQKSGRSTVLDIGCGGGDIIRMLHGLCRQDGLQVSFTGIDPDERALHFVDNLKEHPDIQFSAVTSQDLVHENRKFDVVISNHLIHHLKRHELKSLCSDAALLAEHLVLFSDIERSDVGYAAFAIFAPLLFRNSYIVKDGLISIKRSFRKDELQEILGSEWLVKRQFPFRLQAIHHELTNE